MTQQKAPAAQALLGLVTTPEQATVAAKAVEIQLGQVCLLEFVQTRRQTVAWLQMKILVVVLLLMQILTAPVQPALAPASSVCLPAPVQRAAAANLSQM